MKRILCPKCDNYITFDETKYTEGQSLVFICEHCKKQFSIRIGKTKLKATRKEEVLDEQANKKDCGSIVVVENVFGYKQVHPLKEGDNVIGRRNKGTEVDLRLVFRYDIGEHQPAFVVVDGTAAGHTPGNADPFFFGVLPVQLLKGVLELADDHRGGCAPEVYYGVV